MTKAETELVERVWAMHAGDEDMVVGHYLPANRLSTPLGFSRFQKQHHPRFSHEIKQCFTCGSGLDWPSDVWRR